MTRFNLLDPFGCPTCGGKTSQGYGPVPGDHLMPDLYESCERVRYHRRKLTDPMWEPWRCSFFKSPPRWLVDALKGAPPPRAFNLRWWQSSRREF